MPIKTLVFPSRYFDSVRLMQVGRDVSRLEGVADAAVVMATEANQGILRQAGLLSSEAENAGPNDLVVVVIGEDETRLGEALKRAKRLLEAKPSTGREAAGNGYRSRTLRGARKANSLANLAVISVAGRYAAREAWDALHAGLHVLLFSDNVSLEEEITLKDYAASAGLLLMGPGAGTALINGVGLGFANAVPQGPVGIVSAAGTGLQEASSILARLGSGVSQGIGVGGRDLKVEVGGRMMFAGLYALQNDPATQAILMISKPPADAIAEKMVAEAARSEKPVIVCFLGNRPGSQPEATAGPVIFTSTLEEAAYTAALAGGCKLPPYASLLEAQEARIQQSVAELLPHLAVNQRWLRGLYSGGTLCYEAQALWRDRLADPVLSNAPLLKENQLPDSSHSTGHTALDLGEEEFTVGRPHPMIDYDLRLRRFAQEACDPQVAAILMDIVLGYGAHPDPASEAAPVIQAAQQAALSEGRALPVILSITGTSQDPQGYDRQAEAFESAGAIVCESHAAAARLAACLAAKVAQALERQG